jgi:hypothetical protein
MRQAVTRAWIFWVAAAAVAGTLQGQSVRRMQAWFVDGTGLEIYSESTGSTQPSSQGEMGAGPGGINRVVLDSSDNILFAYNLEASRGAVPGTAIIRIEPLNAAAEEGMLKWKGNASHLSKLSGGHIPTVAAVREFSSVTLGEVVTLDVLYNPATGEKIYDVLRPIKGSSPMPGTMGVNPSPSREEISFKDIVVKVDGKVMRAPASWMIGAAVRIDIPGHGAYVVAAYDPQNLPPIYAFQQLAQGDGKTLRWAMDRDKVEITSSTNVLTQAANGPLWLYHDPHYRTQDQPDAIRLQTADTVEWLIPKGKG